jgi:hypothetical protein
VEQFIGTLFHSRTQAHIAHLQTNSFAAHKALNEYYDGIIEFVDSLAETYQGKHGIIKGYKIPASKDLSGDMVIEYFQRLSKFVELKRKKLPQDPCLMNVVDEIQALVDTTVYKLKYLK